MTISQEPAHHVAVVLSVLMACSQASDYESAGSLARFSLSSESLRQWKLPRKLSEISGLALTPDGRLLAICDESAIVYELDYKAGKILKAFALGRPTERGDFEGIAYLNDTVFLVTSDGRLYASIEGADGERVSYRMYRTGLGKVCEIEGLAANARTKKLMLACKDRIKKGKRNDLSVFYWSPSTRALIGDEKIVLPERKIEKLLGKKRVNPSGIAIDPKTGNLFIIAARQRAVIELEPNGDLVGAIILPLAGRHRQPEGVSLTRDGQLLIADEGSGKRATLSIYNENRQETP
ncbi:MAG: SdiA-regulated domain-containing protein [Woeseia sp.]